MANSKSIHIKDHLNFDFNEVDIKIERVDDLMVFTISSLFKSSKEQQKVKFVLRYKELKKLKESFNHLISKIPDPLTRNHGYDLK